MEVKHQGCTLVKPAPATADKEIPLTIFDKKASDLHIAVIFVYNAKTATNDEIKQGLARALAYYPQLAGRLVQDPRRPHSPNLVVDRSSGVPVTETTVAGRVEDYLPIEPSPSLLNLHPPVEGANPLFVVQLNRFECGGLVIGLSASHKVADGQSMSDFFVSWARLVREQKLEQPPLHEHPLLSPRDPPTSLYPHDRVEFSGVPPVGDNGDVETMENLKIKYSWQFVRELKERAGHVRPGIEHSTFEVLLAHVWRKTCVARGLADDEVTQVRVLVNGRPRLGVPQAFFGNLVLEAYPNTKVKHLKDGVGYGARLIKDAVSGIGHDYFRSFIDFGELNKDKELVPSQDVEDNFLIPNLEVDSWLGFRFHEVDMGGGPPCDFLPSWIPMEGLVVIVRAPADKEEGGKGDAAGRGSINVIVTLFREHAEIFKKIAHSID